MNKLRQLPVGAQVLLTFGTLSGVLVIIGGLFFFSLRAIELVSEAQQSRALKKLALIDDTAQDVGQMQAGALRQVLTSDLGEVQHLDQIVREIEKINSRELTDYQRFVDTEKERQLYDQVMQARKAYWEQTQTVLALGLKNHDTEAIEFIITRQAPAYDESIKALNGLIKYVETDAQDAARATTRFISRIRIIGDTLAGIAIVIAIGTGFAVAGVGRRLKEDNRLLQVEVTERRRVEEELRWKTAFLEAQVNSSIDGILVVDEHGKKTLQNQRLADLWKMPQPIADDKDDKKQRQWVAEATRDPAQFLEKVTYLNSHRDEISRDEIELKDGTILDRYSSPVVGKDGEYYGRIWTFRDITERKQLEAQLFQSQKMETVGKLAGGVAHEFNSILTAIIGRSELLLSDLPPGSPHCANAIAIRKAADLAAALTQHLLAYGRKQLLRPETLNLNEVLGRMEGVLHHLMGSEVDVRIVPAVGLPAVKADAGQIEQVIMNIAINAREAMPHGGKLTLETSQATLDEEYVRRFPELKAGNYVMLAISDTGTGMSEEAKTHLFEPFFTTKGVGEGAGLGLAICHGIIKQSGGHINAYSEPGRGTTFKVYLPQVQQRTKDSPLRPASTDLPRGTETILLVEDDPSLREMASLLLQRLGYAVLVAANGPEALSLTNQRDAKHIDLLFTDVVMPQMDGKELSDRIRAAHPQTKTLFTSAYTENAAIHQGVLHEGVALLQKPFTPSALAVKLRAVLDDRS